MFLNCCCFGEKKSKAFFLSFPSYLLSRFPSALFLYILLSLYLYSLSHLYIFLVFSLLFKFYVLKFVEFIWTRPAFRHCACVKIVFTARSQQSGLYAALRWHLTDRGSIAVIYQPIPHRNKVLPTDGSIQRALFLSSSSLKKEKKNAFTYICWWRWEEENRNDLSESRVGVPP